MTGQQEGAGVPFDRLRGGFYTPKLLARAMARWVLEINPRQILEPSCGDGAVIEAVADELAVKKNASQPSLFAIELVEKEAKKAHIRIQNAGLKNTTIHQGDFLLWVNRELASASNSPESVKLFDAVIGNPPYIRHQLLGSEFQLEAEKFYNLLGVKFTKTTNSWASFLLASVQLLAPNGRLAMAIPTELIHTQYAKPIRKYLREQCVKVVIIDPKKVMFDGLQQGIVILLLEKKEGDINADALCKLAIHSIDRFNPDTPLSVYWRASGQTISDCADNKWTRFALSSCDQDLIAWLSTHKKVTRLGELADVRLGLVTGANAFFVLTKSEVKKHGLERFALPVLAKSQHCEGVLFNKEHHERNTGKDIPSYLIYLCRPFDELPLPVQLYILEGESKELHRRYKCRVRTPWYTLPRFDASPLLLTKHSHLTPKLIHNDFGAYCSDAFYQIYPKEGISPQILAANFINPLTAISAELEGRSYGGGALGLVPTEIRQLLLPSVSGVGLGLVELSQLTIEKGLETAIQRNWENLAPAIGLTAAEAQKVVVVWKKLVSRRVK